MNLSVYHLLQQWLNLLPFAFEKPVNQCLLLIQEAEILSCKPVSCLLLFRERHFNFHRRFFVFCCKGTEVLWKVG